MSLESKIEHSIKILKFAENFAKEQNYRLILAYSGGKDSDVLLDLAKKTGIEFETVFKNTTVENIITCNYIRKKGDDIVWENPKRNFYQICMHKKGLPSIFRRFCCNELKEKKIKKSVTLFGIRKCESVKRAKYWDEFSNKKELKLPFNHFEKLFEEKCKSKSVYFNPIFNFTDIDIWNYIKENNLEINPIYANQSRCGCWLCPFAPLSQKMKIIRKNPSILKPLIKTVQYLIDNKAPITKAIPDLLGIIEWFLTQETIKKFSNNRRNVLFNEKSEIEKIILKNNLI